MTLIEATTRYIREERGEVRGTKGREKEVPKRQGGIHRDMRVRKGMGIREHESQCVDGRSNLNCYPEEAVR